MRICIFCSANKNIAPVYYDRTRDLCRFLVRKGHSIVFGGCALGLMECVAKSVHDAGGMSIGIVPSIVERGGRASEYCDVKILCDNLTDRKELMMTKSDLFIALPGGVGTLDEIFTVVASASIGYHHKRVVLYNIDGFWNPLLDMLADMRSKGMIRDNLDEELLTASTPDEMAQIVDSL